MNDRLVRLHALPDGAERHAEAGGPGDAIAMPGAAPGIPTDLVP